MRRASVILGFTEAELGFVLAVLFVALAGSQVVRAAEADEKLAMAEQQLDSLRTAADSLDSLVKELRGRTSRLDPYCHERGEPDIVIASVTVLGGGRFSLGGRILTYQGVVEALDRWVSVAREKACRFAIDVVSADDLTVDEFLSARTPLAREWFYFTR